MLLIFRWIGNLLRAIFGGGASPQASPDPGEPRWLKLARAELGVREAPGGADNPAVLAYYRDAGHPEINHDSVAWCAAFVGAILERSGVASSKLLDARSYLKWGKVVAKPYPGCIAVFSRGDPRGWQGHVGFYLEETSDGISLLGGNQGDKVSIAEQPRERLLGYRAPVSGGNSRTLRASTMGIIVAGAGGAAVLDSQTQLMGINAVLKQLGLAMPSFAVIAAGLQIAVFCIIIWARWDDLREKGR